MFWVHINHVIGIILRALPKVTIETISNYAVSIIAFGNGHIPKSLDFAPVLTLWSLDEIIPVVLIGNLLNSSR